MYLFSPGSLPTQTESIQSHLILETKHYQPWLTFKWEIIKYRITANVEQRIVADYSTVVRPHISKDLTLFSPTVAAKLTWK